MRPPRPLVSPEKRLIVLWSPKSACTAAYVWFASVCGFVEDVRRYHRFPHWHRIEVFQNPPLNEIGDLSDFLIVRIVRDPYTRAASIYRQAMLIGLKRPGDMVVREGMPFGAFLNQLMGKDLYTLDPHVWPQVHPLEAERNPDVVINVSKQDLFAELNALERVQGWPETDFAAMDWFHGPEKARSGQAGVSYDTLLNRRARHKIEAIYAMDFQQYQNFL
ncbi:MAG: sulfotransferase family 2 domain-containing protein [Alphaproteobacteria bacterium]|jgi:hypothetical protein|nr:sulfotransferase family 2 domain-containing protein [Alphaproteobacteria bacterium]